MKRMLMKALVSGAAALTIAAGGAQAAETDSLEQIFAHEWEQRLEEDPTFATSLGVRDYDDRLSDRSLAAYDKSIERTKALLARLDNLGASALKDDERLNAELFRREMNQTVEAANFGGRYLAVSNRSGPHTAITGLADELPFFTAADYQSYVARLNAAPSYVEGTIERMAGGVKSGWTQPCAAMEGFEKTIAYHVVADPKKSAMWRPFDKKPAAISAGAWKKLSAAGAAAIRDKAVPAIAAFGKFYEADYKPACRKEIGASALPEGAAYYAFLAKSFTTTDRTPEEIHALGLREVARIRREMDGVMKSVKFAGDFKAFQAFLRSDPQFYAKSADDLMEKNSLAAKKIEGELPKLFTRLPRMPYTLKEIPADVAEGTTTAYYEPPAGDGSRAGVYRVNTSKLETRPLYEIPALTLHEAVPGHHFQIALAQELDLPNFRKYGYVTAFTEGWGLYAESLGLDVGMYDDPYANFGRLSYEMWRACRLVVDTGIHAKGWSRDQAIDYMKENTALSEHNIRAEVDRYIAGPGQALAYKSGELKIKELRARAQKALGSKFDIRRFHDAVLANGAVPLPVLEAEIDAFIAAERARS